jgi:hypothetical protein
MLLREEERDLHLLSAVAPAWMKTGEKISVQNAVTNFGKVSFVAEVIENGMIINFSSNWQRPPQRMIFHFPYFAKIERILEDGRKISLEKDHAKLSPQARRVEIFWRHEAARERLNYTIMVEDFKRQYHERYQLLQAGRGSVDISPTVLPAPPMTEKQ